MWISWYNLITLILWVLLCKFKHIHTHIYVDHYFEIKTFNRHNEHNWNELWFEWILTWLPVDHFYDKLHTILNMEIYICHIYHYECSTEETIFKNCLKILKKNYWNVSSVLVIVSISAINAWGKWHNNYPYVEG